MTVRIQLPSGNSISSESSNILLGTAPDCDVVLPATDGLHPHHAKIRKMANRWMIESAGDWTLVVNSGDPARTGWLQSGDQIHLHPDGLTITFDGPSGGAERSSVDQPVSSVGDRNSTPPTPVQSSLKPVQHTGSLSEPDWHYSVDEEPKGCTTENELCEMLRSGQLAATDKVWKEGMADWVEIQSISTFRQFLPTKAAPPPIKKTSPPPIKKSAPPPIQKTAPLPNQEPTPNQLPTPAVEWHVTIGDQPVGPISFDDLVRMASSGQIQPTNKVWKEGMADWSEAATIDGLQFPPSSPEPSNKPQRPFATPTASQPKGATTVGSSAKLDKAHAFQFGFWGALVVVIIAVFLPWVKATSNVNFDSERDPRMKQHRANLDQFGAEQPKAIKINQSAKASVRGISTTWGILALIITLAAAVFSFMNPWQHLKENAKFAMAGAGVLIVLLGVIAFATASSILPENANVADQVGNRASAEYSIQVGLYLLAVAGIATTICGYLHDWRKHAFVRQTSNEA